MKSCLNSLGRLRLILALPSLILVTETLAERSDLIAGRDFEGWVADLNSENETERLRAAKTIGLFGVRAVPALTVLLEEKEPSIRYWAASQLGDLGPAAAQSLPALRNVYEISPLSVRLALDYAISRIDPAEFRTDALIKGVRSGQRSMACSAADFLGRLGPAARDLLPALAEVRQRAGDYHIKGGVKNAIRSIENRGELEHHVRPKGGNYNPRQFGPLTLDQVPPPRDREAALERPNILWISCEDISPNLGCYGDAYASTPNLDRLAAEGIRFSRAFTPAGVCAVNRTGIITGMYPIAYGGQHMRTNIPFPEGVRCFPEYLRQAGYFCTNKSKTDYQSRPNLRQVWDRQGNGHNDWRDRRPGQPFFSVINLTITHESQIRHGDGRHADLQQQLRPEQIHDPAKASEHLPPIYADTPETRKDWARYHDNISEMDRMVGEILARLEADGLADNTVVMFWSDHGRGLPRGKRWIYESGVHIPLIVRWPGRWSAGTVSEELVSTQDLPPTVLALAGLQPKEYMHGRVFLGARKQPEPEMLFFHRDRMDEALEFMRAVRDRRYKYIRNFEPGRPYAQHIDYMDKMPTLVDLRRLHQEGRLDQAQSQWFRSVKPVEELYDLERDPYETVNLAELPEQQERLRRLRSALERWQVKVGDTSFVPEPILFERLNRKSTNVSDAP